jgi:PTH1 family peptidyl-tRNA hydrolase
MKIVIGLGNPGLAYRGTRHNAGATAVGAFAKSHGFVFKSNRSFKSLVAEKKAADPVVLLVLPQTFMNLSGDAVTLVLRNKNIPPEDVLVVYDDVALPLGSLRIRPSGSAGGHNGLASVIDRLKTTEIPRLRIGIGRGDEHVELKGHVLSRFTRVEAPVVRRTIERAADAIDLWISQGIQPCMNSFNTKETREE